MDRNDINAPQIQKVPFWGADGYSVRMAVRNFLRAQPAQSALTGVGVRPAPLGSESEGTKTDRVLPPQQFFRSSVGKVADPTIKNVPTVSSYPNTNSPGVPMWLADWTNHQLAGR